MKKIISLFLLFVVPAAFAQNKIRYPVVVLANGQVQITEGDKERTLKLGENLKEKADIQVGDKSQMRIDLSAKTSLLALENSSFLLPFIAWEDGKIEQIDLRKGRIHLKIGQGETKTVVTALSRDFLNAGEYIYTYEPAAPQIEVMVVSGELEFRGLENEEFVRLKAGEKASFLGVLEGGEPVYDVLLKGRKLARGKLNKVQKIPGSDLKQIKKQNEIKKVIVKKSPKLERTASQICGAPNAELNQCAWICEKNPKKAKACDLSAGAVCVRKRCNANGEWAERTELTPLEAKCGLQPVVLACDY